jgi:DNA primase large subunit
MQQLHARYPFLSVSREAVEAADVDLAAVVRDGGAPVDRGVERVERALVAGTVAPEGHWSTRAELLSYPVARVLVSLVDVRGAVEKYARAEAALAYDRFTADFDEDAQLKSSGEGTLTLESMLADFGLASDARPTGDGRFSIAVGAYLQLSASLGDDWRLATRALTDGQVTVTRRELYDLLREAVRRRVADGLPLSVPEPIATALNDEVETLREALSPVERTRDVDTFAPTEFPPCMQALAERGREGELDDTGRFALLSFVASTGAPFEQLAALLGVRDLDAADQLRYQYERLAGEGAQFAPPSCATMQANGDCHDPDDLCASIGHPLAYYERRLTGEAPSDD